MTEAKGSSNGVSVIRPHALAAVAMLASSDNPIHHLLQDRERPHLEKGVPAHCLLDHTALSVLPDPRAQATGRTDRQMAFLQDTLPLYSRPGPGTLLGPGHPGTGLAWQPVPGQGQFLFNGLFLQG